MIMTLSSTFSALYISSFLMLLVYVLATAVGLVIYAYYQQIGCDPIRAGKTTPNQVQNSSSCCSYCCSSSCSSCSFSFSCSCSCSCSSSSSFSAAAAAATTTTTTTTTTVQHVSGTFFLVLSFHALLSLLSSAVLFRTSELLFS